ncbi:hypothetical protein H8E77_16795 [bacterium]|nr:hypothetical protein [bacterium]
MDERIKLYYNSQLDTPWCDVKKILLQLEKLEEAGIPVTMVDTASMKDQQLFEHYMEATYPSVRKQYRISQIFGSQSKSGQFFGRQQPALLIYQGEGRHPADVYPHDSNGKRVMIEDFLEQKIRELKVEPEAPSTTYEILDTFTCSVELISGNKAYLRLRNQDEDEDRDLCLEYPLEKLKRNIGEVAEGMFLRCDIREFDDENLKFHFEKSTPKVLSLEERQALLEEYKGLFDEDE